MVNVNIIFFLKIFINNLKRNYDELEKRVELAESKEHIGKLNKFKSFFNKMI